MTGTSIFDLEPIPGSTETPPTTEQPTPMKRGLIRRFFGGIWWLIVGTVLTIIAAVILIFRVEVRFISQYVGFVNAYTGDGTLGMDGSAKPSHWLIRYPIRFFLWLLVPIVALLIPVGVFATVTGLLVAADQALYPKFPISTVFSEVDTSPQDGKPATTEEIGSALFTATYNQLESELDSTLGWGSNDTIGFQFLDNRASRQQGVLFASYELLGVLSTNISKYGPADAEDKRLVEARQRGLSQDPTLPAWNTFPFIESRYRGAIEGIKSFQSDVLTKQSGAHVNITNANIATVMEVINNKVLEIPRGYLPSRNKESSWFELDNEIFYAQGSAIVARDALVAIRGSFGTKFADRGAMENLNLAIDSLDAAIEFHPWWVMRGDGDAMFADHRSKLARYFTEVDKRIEEVVKALRG